MVQRGEGGGVLRVTGIVLVSSLTLSKLYGSILKNHIVTIE